MNKRKGPRADRLGRDVPVDQAIRRGARRSSRRSVAFSALCLPGSAGAAARAAGELVGGRSLGPVQAFRMSAVCAKEAIKPLPGASLPCLL